MAEIESMAVSLWGWIQWLRAQVGTLSGSAWYFKENSSLLYLHSSEKNHIVVESQSPASWIVERAYDTDILSSPWLLDSALRFLAPGGEWFIFNSRAGFCSRPEVPALRLRNAAKGFQDNHQDIIEWVCRITFFFFSLLHVSVSLLIVVSLQAMGTS